ncbi:MAG: class I SAM-dependent methyltransferase [Anaerolineales bacterium]
MLDGKSYGGKYDAFNDIRLQWFFQHVTNTRTILELGSLEGGHTLALARRPGVERVLGLEGRLENLRRAQFVKEVYRAAKVDFELSNLESSDLTHYGQFDAVFCVGLLYHLPEPWKLLGQIARVTRHLFLWTHYAPDHKAKLNQHGWQGMLYKEHGLKDKLSGLSAHSFWPNRKSLQLMIEQAGFGRVAPVHDDAQHVHGPAVTLMATIV